MTSYFKARVILLSENGADYSEIKQLMERNLCRKLTKQEEQFIWDTTH